MKASTSITMRVQAKGGKFLADDIGGAEVTIRDAQTGERLGGGLALGTSSGNLSPQYSADASLSAIVTPADDPGGAPTINWLSPDANTSGLTAKLAISRPTLLEISAFGPLGGLQSAHRVTATQWIVPGQALDQGPGFVVEIPGLLVQVMEPATHLEILQTSLPYKLHFRVNVTMMCGCQIDHGQTWIPGDFDVTAAIGPVGQRSTDTVRLHFPGREPSLFTRSFEVPGSASGSYQAVVTAIQRSTGNTGTGTVTFSIKA